jgi:hypothetical protein
MWDLCINRTWFWTEIKCDLSGHRLRVHVHVVCFLFVFVTFNSHIMQNTNNSATSRLTVKWNRMKEMNRMNKHASKTNITPPKHTCHDVHKSININSMSSQLSTLLDGLELSVPFLMKSSSASKLNPSASRVNQFFLQRDVNTFSGYMPCALIQKNLASTVISPTQKQHFSPCGDDARPFVNANWQTFRITKFLLLRRLKWNLRSCDITHRTVEH